MQTFDVVGSIVPLQIADCESRVADLEAFRNLALILSCCSLKFPVGCLGALQSRLTLAPQIFGLT